MARVYALISQKGGAGKSTLATHFAGLAGEREAALLVDRDPQQTTTKWCARRAALDPPPGQWPELVSLEGEAIGTALGRFTTALASIFVDTRPAVQEPEAEAARSADLIIVPVRPTVNDLEAVLDTLAMVRRVKRPAVIVVNAARNEGRAQAARAALSQWGVPVCPNYLTDRTVYHDAAVEGRTTMEMRGAAAEAATAELRKVWNWIEEMER